MPRRRKPKPRTSGPTQPEDKRKAKQVLLRLAPDVAARLRAIAGPRGVSAWVTRAVFLSPEDVLRLLDAPAEKP
jgi:hypothetical protein